VLSVDDADGIQAMDLALRYDSRRVKVVDVRTGAMTSGYSLVRNDLDGESRMALFGLEPLAGSGVLLLITVETDGVLTNDDLGIEAQLNEGGIPVDIETRLDAVARPAPTRSRPDRRGTRP
jgi:hypothetical protein